MSASLGLTIHTYASMCIYLALRQSTLYWSCFHIRVVHDLDFLLFIGKTASKRKGLGSWMPFEDAELVCMSFYKFMVHSTTRRVSVRVNQINKCRLHGRCDIPCEVNKTNVVQARY